MHKAYWQSVGKMHSGSTTLSFQIVLRASVFAAALMTMAVAQALPLDSVNSSECMRGDCENGKGTLELKTDFGKGMYRGEFLNGKFHGKGRLEIPVSFLEKSIYVGDWDEGIRSGRGTYWNGDGKLYIGQWSGDKRNGHGSYFFGLPRWEENEHSEYWLSQNTENYTGNFVNDHYQGEGTYRWPNGQRYEGKFFASKKHGPGTFFYATGTRRNQVWEYGRFIM
jgi:hypothetical protein